MTELIRIQHTPEAAAVVGAIIAESFHDLEVSTWIVRPDEDRRQVLPPYFALFTEHAFAHGEVYVTADMSAAAVWFDNQTPPLPDVPDLEARLAAFAGSHAQRFTLLGEEMDKRHPHDPHCYLAFLAVVPNRQSQGLGSRLLAEHHRRLDEAGTAAYLEASNARSREFYLRHGYADLGEPLILPDGPPMFPMWRPPAS
ncbi:GNAT family N-acetyltransferase [Sphaerimonospora sp. CA-214678]|uniref:GNAT family N-acetyltransferase n=1 Tax=Sphaerimonospora sp. CA-214678 TaxID=3240029 RepID=UPI003D938335